MNTKKLLTREQVANLALEVTQWLSGYDGDNPASDDFSRLLDHISAVDVYAKPELARKEIAEKIARLQGWVKRAPTTVGIPWYEHNGTRVCYVHGYRPSENLLQALDAAYALDMPNTMFVSNREYQVFTNICGEREISPPNLTSQQAAAWICMRLLEHLVEPLDSA